MGDGLFLQIIHLPAKIFLHIKTQPVNPVALAINSLWTIAPFACTNLARK
jgi:hypothetical protein